MSRVPWIQTDPPSQDENHHFMTSKDRQVQEGNENRKESRRDPSRHNKEHPTEERVGRNTQHKTFQERRTWTLPMKAWGVRTFKVVSRSLNRTWKSILSDPSAVMEPTMRWFSPKAQCCDQRREKHTLASQTKREKLRARREKAAASTQGRKRKCNLSRNGHVRH